MIAIFVISTSYTLLTITRGMDGEFYPGYYTKKSLATNLHCKVNESSHFRYAGTTLISENTGTDSITMKADVIVKCLGDDKGGKYGSEALKYRAYISEMVIESINHRTTGEPKSQPNNTYQRKPEKSYFSYVKSTISHLFTKDATKKSEVTSQASFKEPEIGIPPDFDTEEWRKQYSVPFEFVQLANGSVPEIRFAENEVDDKRTKNFKRHLVDAFATSLDLGVKQNEIVETSNMGEHTAVYKISENQGSNSKYVSFGTWYSGNSKNPETNIMVKKQVTNDNIRKLAPSKAINNLENMDLKVEQDQVFKNGKLTLSRGTAFADLFSVLKNKTSSYKKVKANETMSPEIKFQITSSFEMELIENSNFTEARTYSSQINGNLKFKPTSRFGEIDDTRERQNLRELQESAGDISEMIQNMVKLQDENYDEDMDTLSKIVQGEIDLKVDNETKSASGAIRRIINTKTLEKICSSNATVCEDFIRLLAVAGGPEAEAVFLSLLKENKISLPQQRMIAGQFHYFSFPSGAFFDSLIEMMSKKDLDKDIMTSLILGIGSMGFQAEVKEKDKIAKVFVDMLKKHTNGCKILLLDILEAIGNLGYRNTVSSVLEVSQTCEENHAIQIACMHALRHEVDLSQVELWMKSKLTNSVNCDVLEGILHELLQTINQQTLIGETSRWPRNGFKQIDENLKQLLQSPRCSKKNILQYFREKKNKKANFLAKMHIAREAKYSSSLSSTNISELYGFPNESAIFTKVLKVGPDSLHLENYAGMFLEYNLTAAFPRVRFLTNIYSAINAFGLKVNIASFYLYCDLFSTRSYFRIFHYTVFDKSQSKCTPFKKTKTIRKVLPAVGVSFEVVSASLAIDFEGWVGLYLNCPAESTFEFGPMMGFRVSGGAIVELYIVNFGITLGGTLNYRIGLNFQPMLLCTWVEHGIDPIEIDLKGYVQYWKFWSGEWSNKTEFGLFTFDATKRIAAMLSPKKCYSEQ